MGTHSDKKWQPKKTWAKIPSSLSLKFFGLDWLSSAKIVGLVDSQWWDDCPIKDNTSNRNTTNPARKKPLQKRTSILYVTFLIMLESGYFNDLDYILECM